MTPSLRRPLVAAAFAAALAVGPPAVASAAEHDISAEPPASAAAASAPRTAAAGRGSGSPVLRPPMLLPGDAAASSVSADAGTWLVGARPGNASRAVARRFGARAVSAGAWSVRRDRARAFSGALAARGLLVYAEPNRLSVKRQAIPPDPLSPQAAWRDFVVDPALAPPPVTPTSPLLALVDSSADITHPEFAGGNTTRDGEALVEDSHGTATSAIASAPKNDVGILGIWPGMRATNVPLPQRITCEDSTRQITRSTALGAAVINMSYGSLAPCFAEYHALQAATARGVNLVAAAGNEFGEGNPLEFPASLPHVLTVAAITPSNESAYFSNANAAMDLSAPGVGILTAVPPAFDTDGTADGYQAVDGTSFSAPMVAAATAWIRAARPDLSVDQAAQVIRLSARDVLTPGWDPSTGFGVLNVAAALTRAAPPRDPNEPNEDILWVDGRAFGQPDRPIYRSGRSRTLRGLLDKFEDPSDVYRIVFPRRSRLTISVKPRFGDADLAAFFRSARSVEESRHLIDRSARNGTRTDTLRLRNRSSGSRSAYLQVYIDSRAESLDAGYTLTIRRR